jgi:hypothetical protein
MVRRRDAGVIVPGYHIIILDPTVKLVVKALVAK